MSENGTNGTCLPLSWETVEQLLTIRRRHADQQALLRQMIEQTENPFCELRLVWTPERAGEEGERAYKALYEGGDSVIIDEASSSIHFYRGDVLLWGFTCSNETSGCLEELIEAIHGNLHSEG